jgi:hypothetical protein
MKEDDIVYLPGSMWGFAMLPEETHVALFLAEFEGILQYLDLGTEWSTERGVYTRITDIIPFEDSTIVRGTTFPVSTGEVRLICLCIPNDTTVQLAVVENPEILAALTRNDAVKLATLTDKGKSPAVPVVKKSRREELDEVLEQFCPGNYGWNNSGGYENLYINWPEFEIINSRGQKRTLYDLVIKLGFTNSLSCFRQGITGRRYTLLSSEIEAGYRHSHLPSSTNDFNSFCLGHSAMSNMMIDGMSPFDPEWFFVFLVQLDLYVRWESIEGGPHIGMGNVGNSRNGQVAEADWRPPQWSDVTYAGGRVLPLLDASHVHRVVNPDGTVFYKLVAWGRKAQELKALIDMHWPATRRQAFNTQTGNYVAQRQGQQGNSNNVSSFLGSRSLGAGALSLAPRIKDNADIVDPAFIIQVAPPAAYLPVICYIETFLNNKLPAQFTGSLTTTPEVVAPASSWYTTASSTFTI